MAEEKKEVAPKKATTKKKAPAKKKVPAKTSPETVIGEAIVEEVSVEDSKSEVEVEEVLEAVEPVVSGGIDPEPTADSGDESADVSAKAPRRVVSTLWTS